MKISTGYDRHLLCLAKNGKIKVGGVDIECGYDIVAHSDGDVIIHAVTDSISSMFLRQTIGELFPDNYEKYKNADSSFFLKEVYKRSNCPKIINLDIIVISDQVMIKSKSEEIADSIARMLNLTTNDVTIKGRRKEELNGSPAIECFCTILFS